MPGQSLIPKGATLYDRLGGDVFIHMLVCNFFDEIVENPGLQPFFRNISVSALKTHQVKLFRVIFGKEEEKPEEEDLLDYMLRTHTRLFRELGLNEAHFDMVASCFVQGLQTFQVDQGMVDECVAILVPLRVIFEYGAQVAAREKLMDEDTKKALPVATPKTIGTSLEVILPDYSKIEIPDWLPEALKKGSRCGEVRAWTCDMTDRFGAEGDIRIADTFMDQPYMDHHVYLVAFLELAFLPESVDKKHSRMSLEIVQYPRGRRNAKLSRELFVRMITQFQLTCHKMGASNHVIKQAEQKLRAYLPMLAKKTTVVGGVDAPHSLGHGIKNDGPADDWQSDTISVTSLSIGDLDTEPTCSGSSNSLGMVSGSEKSRMASKKSMAVKSNKGNRPGSAIRWLVGTIWASKSEDKTQDICAM